MSSATCEIYRIVLVPYLGYNAGVMPKPPTTQPATEFARWLESEMQSRGWERKTLALASGVGQSTISQIIGGVRKPSRDMVKRLARALPPSDGDLGTSRSLIRAGFKAAGFSPTEADDSELPVSTYELTRSIIRQKGFDEQEFSGQEVDQIQSGVEALIEGYLSRKRQDRGE